MVGILVTKTTAATTRQCRRGGEASVMTSRTLTITSGALATAPGKQDVVAGRDVGLHRRSTAVLSSVLSSGLAQNICFLLFGSLSVQ